MEVIEVTDQELAQQLASNPKVVIKYYADWCGSCKLFNPKYKRLAKDERFQDVTFLNINAENNPDARAKGSVANLPSFAIVENGEFKETVATSKEDAVVALIEKLK
ncbi:MULTISPECIES: thioredoxin family protein [Reichenbachiella]|uniref:Thioredoxin n=1 Tax=Reichenbachiella agariperforans TaxID=156994 RepID=A0A1M6JHQ3_REIAG|nr:MULTISPECIES: thioredoxin family protein [Reichenbachiella]MBU2913203.1 thioredoxin family protein [Reichenbachiella agariperforans]RJE74799.1 thiol reductase thioredoxin [Reichenbachiella sp. MSK19-1]SHJ46237.1 Thioredoxin [Reichenbachiella agariperforans]